MNRKLMLFAPFALLLSACSIPMNTAEFRQAAKANAALLTYETFEVNRPTAEVANTFREKGSECLNFKLGEAKRGILGTSKPHYYAETREGVVVSKDRTELSFQVHYENTLNKEPDGGTYFLVADAYPVSKKKTRVDVYRRTSVDLLLQALKGWASGENLGCPDPMKIL